MAKDLVDLRVDRLKKLAQQSHMNAKEVKSRRDEMVAKQNANGGKFNKWDIAPVPDKLPSGRPNPVASQWHTRADRATAMGVDRDDKAGRTAVARGGRTVAQTGAELSPREAAVQKQGDPAWDPNRDAVKWEEGTRIWVMNERDSWVQIQRRLSLPIGAGPSGSTNLLMQVAKLFGTDPYAARAAAIAYLLPPRHHTLVEILTGAAAFGCAFHPGQQMYRDIQPFSPEELKSCGKGGKFPDEPPDAASPPLTASSATGGKPKS